jgi:hypothetical protein
VAECVRGQEVEASAENEGRRAAHRVHDALHGGTDALWRRPSARWAASGTGGVEQVEQMGPFSLVQLQRVRDTADHAFGDAGRIAALEPGVVLGRDAGQEGNLFTSQA